MSLRFTALMTSLTLVGALAAPTAYAADEAGKPTKSSIAPAGEGPGAQASAPSKMSDKSRTSVKADTKAQGRSGGLAPAGETTAPIDMTTNNVDADKAKRPSATSDKSRSEVKSQTKAARATGTLKPAGEAAQPLNEPPKK